MKTATETRHILDKLETQHPNADTELHHRNAFELLVATILSAQSTDQRVNMVTPALFKRYPDARALAQATTDELEPQILSTGFFRAKSRSLLGMAKALVETHGGEVPADMAALTELPGVGRKTANVVLGHALGVPGLPVDRHVLRVSNRIGIAEGDNPEVVEQQLCEQAAEVTVDSHVRHADSAWPTDLPAETALPGLRRPGRLRLLPRAPARRPPGPIAESQEQSNQTAAKASRPEAMTRAAFERHVSDALATIPKRFRDAMRNIAIVVEDEPSVTLLREMEIDPPDTLFGLYQGVPLTERRWDYGNALPDRIVLVPGPARA